MKFKKFAEKLEKDKDDPCWDDYVQVGTKMKNGKEVPNCVPKNNESYKKKKTMKDSYKAYMKDAYKKKKAMKESPEDDMPASPDEKSMAMDQAKFISYVGKEIIEYLQEENDFPEWMQNKLSGLHEKARGLHSAMIGQSKKMDMDDMSMDDGYIEDEKKVECPKCEGKGCDHCDDKGYHIMKEEAEYQGRKVKLNDPFRTPDGPKKFSVYVKNEKGNVVKVNFGDPNMEIKRDSDERRKSFRARHNCDNPGPKTKARYWSCYQWRDGAKVDN